MSKFTAKHYNAVAEVLKAQKPAEPDKDSWAAMKPTHRKILSGRESMHYTVTEALADMFQRDNVAFDSLCFRIACGYRD